MRDLNSMDLDFKNLAASIPGGENLQNCYLCGTCTSGCPVSALDGSYNPRLIMRKVLLGMKEEVLSSPDIWQCSQCHTCVAHCPQNVRFADVIRVLRRLAVEEGYISQAYAAEVERIDLETRQERLDRIKKLTKR